MKATRIGESYWVATPEWTLEFAQLREHAEGMTAEVTAASLTTGQSYWARLNLGGPRSRAEFAKAAEQTVGGEWRAVLDQACRAVITAERMGSPAVAVVATRPDPARWLVPGLFPLGQTSILYGDGGTGKSLMALALALSGLTGTPIAGEARWAVAPLRAVLYLDWESELNDINGRVWALTAQRQAPPTTLYHRPMHRPVAELVPALQAEIARHHVDLVIVDSLTPACGLEPEGAEAATRTMNALRALSPGGPPVTRLIVAHVSKGAMEAAGRTGGAKPYGSVFNRNLARSAVEAKCTAPLDEDPPAPGEDSAMVVTYRHDKLNSGPLLPPTALRWAYDREGYITACPGAVSLAHLGIPQRILHALDGGKKSVQALAEELGITPMVARARLNEMESVRKVVRFSDPGLGRGRKTLWGRPDKKRTGEPH